MRIKHVLLGLIFIFTLMVDWSNVAQAKVLFENIITLTIDGFETPGEWVIKFSKYRSKNWDNDLTKEFEDSNTWLKWIGTDTHKREEILPDAVQKNAALTEKEKTILAIKGKWDFPGYNWFVLEPNNVRPAKDALTDWLALVARDKTWEPRKLSWDAKYNSNFIWLTGKTKSVSVYVWGGNFKYNLEAHFQDFKGNTFILPLSSLNYKGWRNLRTSIPNAFRQSQHRLPNTQPLKFMRFKVISDPYEDPWNFYMYIDYFHAIADTYEPSFFGEELQFVEKYWNQGNAGNNTATNTQNN